MPDSGLISIQSHTYDMHQWEPYESTAPARSTILSFDGESEKDYIEALENDTETMESPLEENGVNEVFALAFPEGQWGNSDKCCACV